MMKERTLRVLEFTKIRDMLTEKALTDLGAEKCQALVPSTNFQEVTAWQEETEEALVVLTYLGGHPMAPFTDVRPYLNLCDKGATLSPKALLEIAGLMRACRTARAALVTDRENTPRLKEKAGLLPQPGGRHHNRHYLRGRDRRPGLRGAGQYPPPPARGHRTGEGTPQRHDPLRRLPEVFAGPHHHRAQ